MKLNPTYFFLYISTHTFISCPTSSLCYYEKRSLWPFNNGPIFEWLVIVPKHLCQHNRFSWFHTATPISAYCHSTIAAYPGGTVITLSMSHSCMSPGARVPIPVPVPSSEQPPIPVTVRSNEQLTWLQVESEGIIASCGVTLYTIASSFLFGIGKMLLYLT